MKDLLLAVGVIITNIGFLMIVPKGLGFLGVLEYFNRVCYMVFLGIMGGMAGGLFINSLFAAISRYSLNPDNAPHSWVIISGVAVFIGNFCAFLRFKEHMLKQNN